MAKRKRIAPVPAPKMGDVVQRISALGLEVLKWRNESQDGWWIPELAASTGGFILWRAEGTSSYPFAHYEVSCKRTWGGAHQDLHGAVAWYEWAASGFPSFARRA